MTSRIRLYNHWGEFETLLDGIPTTPRSWVVNKYGRCEFSISTDDPKCTERNLRFGNLVHIEHIPPTSTDEGEVPSGKLPDWVGVILPPRSWDEGVVHVTAYSAEAVLAYRAMPYVTVNGPPDVVFKKIIEYANTRVDNMPLRFQLGQIDTSDRTWADDLKTNAYDHINKMCASVEMDWSITAKLSADASGLILFANLIARKGGRQFPVGAPSQPPEIFALTTTNTESQNPLLTEQGTILNHIFAYSQAATEADRVMQEIVYDASVSDYGPFQINTVYLGQHDETSIADSARTRAGGASSASGRPSKLFKRIALDVGATFDHLRIRGLLMVVEPRAGFNQNGTLGFRSLVGIVSMDYNDLTDKVNLNVEVIT